MVTKKSRTSTAEAFRLLRTNLDFMMTDVSTSCKSVFVTSTTSGEGKSFVSVNLACTLALSGKKVALVGMDLRATKIAEYLRISNPKGVSNFIKNKDIQLDDLIRTTKMNESLDVICSGVIPPNPAELLLNERVDELFVTLKSDTIIL